MAHCAMGGEIRAVKGGDARGFRSSVLQGVEPQGDNRGGVFGAMNTKYAALLAGLVVVERMGRQHVVPGAGARGRGAVTAAHIGSAIANVAPLITILSHGSATGGVAAASILF